MILINKKIFVKFSSVNKVQNIINNRKSQVSIFIILGMILLLSIVLFIYFKHTVTIIDSTDIPQELEPIKRYVEGCLSKSLSEAVTIIGEQGGYVNIPLNIRSNPSMYISPDRLGIIKMPYWFYKGVSYAPSINTVQKEISSYMEENTAGCINNFEAFEDMYHITPLGEMEIQTFLNREDVTIILDYPIRVTHKLNSTHTKIEKFTTKLDVGLKKIIGVANNILDAEVNQVFLENFTIDLMASNPDVPFTDMRFSCDNLEWHINDVKARVSDMLYYNFPRVRIKNSNHQPFIAEESVYKKLQEYTMEDIANNNFPKNVPEDAYEYLHMYWDMGVDKDDDVSIGFKFIPEVGMDLIGRPHDNGVLRSNVVEGDNKYLRFFCVNLYHFIYDVNYPVIVTIRDDDSLGGRGYMFNFAIPVTIHNNEPHKGYYGYDMFTTPYFDKGFCDELGDTFSDIRAYGSEDGYSNLELNGVNISMQCFKYYCNLGLTKPDEGAYRLRRQLPASCTNPFIIAEKEGYLKSTTQLDDSGRVDLYLTKLKKLDYHVVYHRYNSYGDIIENWKELETDMNVSVQVSNNDINEYKLFPISSGVDENVRTIELIEGDAEYDVNIVLTEDGEYIGGYNGKWKTKGADISSSDLVVFHVLRYVPVPYTEEDKMEMMNFILNGDYDDRLRPDLE